MSQRIKEAKKEIDERIASGIYPELSKANVSDLRVETARAEENLVAQYGQENEPPSSFKSLTAREYRDHLRSMPRSGTLRLNNFGNGGNRHRPGRK